MSNTKFFSRKDLPKRVLSASGLNIKAEMNGTPVTIVDVHYSDETLCYIKEGNGIPVKIETLNKVK